MEGRDVRPSADDLLRELGIHARLIVYLASAPGAGKTRRLLEDAQAQHRAGIRVMIGWIDLKGRPELDALLEGLPRVPARTVTIGNSTFEEFDYEAAVAAHPSTVVLDELAHTNLAGSVHAKRWQDALALRDAGISVLGALNVQHLETVAPVAEVAIGYPIREIVPMSFLRAADQVIAIDVSPELLASRLQAGAIVRKEDVERALHGTFKPQTLHVLRELMLRTLDQLTNPVLSPTKTSTALAVVTGETDPAIFLRKLEALADALDLALSIAGTGPVTMDDVQRFVNAHDAEKHLPLEIDARNRLKLGGINAALIGIPNGAVAREVASTALDRDIFIADPLTAPVSLADPESSARHLWGQTAGDRMRIGYGTLTIYLGSAAGSGKTYAMLDRAHQMLDAGVDVVAALVETHGRADTIRKLEGIPELPRKDGELDVEALLERRPQIALIDELAHTNAPGSEHAKRYEDVLSIVRAGISVITTLNVQHLEGLSDAVYRLTGTRVRETLPDGILELADDVIFIDATPQTLRDRLRAGKIYPKERIEAALTNFFTVDNLSALRELAIRETMRARAPVRLPVPFSHLMVGVKARARDTDVIARCARLAARLQLDLTVVHVARNEAAKADPELGPLADAARKARAGWRVDVDDHPERALVQIARESGNATLIVEGARHRARFLPKRTFGRSLLDAGAKELFLLAASDGEQDRPKR